jgi:tetratricopeptide (TPR) repeat protein
MTWSIFKVMHSLIKRHWPVFIVLSCLTACTGAVHGEAPVKLALSAEDIEARGFVSMNQAVLYNLMAGQLAEKRKEYTQAAVFLLKAGELADNVDILRSAAQAALYAQEYNLVEQATDSWRQLEPDNPEPHQLLAIILLRQERHDDALQHIDALFSSDNADAEKQAHILVKLLSQEVEPEIALDLLARLHQQHPDNSNLSLVYSKFLLDRDKPEKAQQILETLFANNPDNPHAAPIYLQALRQQDKLDQAADWLNARVEDNPDSLMWRELYAHLLVSLDRYPAAMKQYQTLLQAEPDNVTYLFNIGLTALRAKDYQSAQQHFAQVLKHDKHGHHDGARYFLGELAEEHEQYEEALTRYRQIEDHSRYYTNAQARTILILLRLERRAEALEYLQQFDAEQAVSSETLRHLEAELLAGEEQFEDALAIYNELLAENPDDIKTLYARAMLGEQMDDLTLLEQDLRRIIELEPEHVDALNALGYTLADRTQRFQEAYELIKRALELDPDAFHIIDSMGWVLYRLGKHEEALSYLQRALDMHYDPEVASHVIEVLWQMGNKEEARKLWREADKTFPDNKNLQRVKQQFTL